MSNQNTTSFNVLKPEFSTDDANHAVDTGLWSNSGQAECLRRVLPIAACGIPQLLRHRLYYLHLLRMATEYFGLPAGTDGVQSDRAAPDLSDIR